MVICCLYFNFRMHLPVSRILRSTLLLIRILNLHAIPLVLDHSLGGGGGGELGLTQRCSVCIHSLNSSAHTTDI